MHEVSVHYMCQEIHDQRVEEPGMIVDTLIMWL